MMFQTLSHAGMRVCADGKELLFDPWIIGSVYWRSWWNYPPVPKSLVEELRPDFIYLTHLHWDHFQAASLGRFPDDVQMLVPYDRHGRMTKDLADIGKTNVRELRHGERVELGKDFALTSYHIGPFVTDSAVVVEADGKVLLNANDAKFAGAPLRQIKQQFPEIDFCFRSHSSANSRMCYHYLDVPDKETDDQEHYLRSFYLFMKSVKPRYAIPFASNNCHLHDDVFEYNQHIQTPDIVRNYFTERAKEDDLETEIKVMIPGDSWSDDNGFALQDHDYFSNRQEHLQAYRERVSGALEKQRKKEAQVKVNLPMMRKFMAQLSQDCPALLLRPLKGREVLIVARSDRGDSAFAVDLYAGKVEQVLVDNIDDYTMRIEFPAIILVQSITMNMFGHASISKRVHYYATQADMPLLQRFVAILEWKEAEVIPIRNHLSGRTVRAALPRWREGLLYSQVILDRLRGRDFIEIEERLLAS